MGNKDGIIEAILAEGTNKVIKFDGGYFSFAGGDEIALCINDNFYILNCNSKLWNLVKAKTDITKDINVLIEWWIELSESGKYEISDWSNDFDDLTEETKNEN